MAKWTKSEEEFLKNNWLKMTSYELGEKLHRNFYTVSAKARKMELENKRNRVSNSSRNKGIENYGPSPESMKEINGRAKMLELLRKKKEFQLNQNLLIKSVPRTEKAKSETIRGKIIQKTDSIITLQGKTHKVSFSYIDFYTGSAIIL